MKKLILTSLFATVGLFAQSATTPAAPQGNSTQAPANQTPAQTQQKHKHKKSSKNSNGTTGNTPAPASTSSGQVTPNQSGAQQKPQQK